MKARFLWCVALAGLLGLGSGCALFVVGAAAGAGAAGYAYVNGELRSTESVTLKQAVNATVAGFQELEFPVTSQKKDALEAEIVARNSSDKRITVKLKSVSEKSTELRIRVGTFGDETLSRTVYERIKKHL